MYTLMLVDDEYMILKGIPQLLDWADLDIKIVKAERSPLAALDYLKDNQVDILLSDMNMAELSGTKFLPAVKQIQPQIQIVVLSGYEDFSYAKTGLEQGVVDYLNKPVDPDELEEAMEKAKARIKKAKQIAHQSDLANQTRVRDVLRGRVSLSELGNVSEQYYLLALIKPGEQVRQFLAKFSFVLGYQEEKDIIYVILPTEKEDLQSLTDQLLPLVAHEIVSQSFTEEQVTKVATSIKKRAMEINFYDCETKQLSLSKNSKPLRVAELVSDFNDRDWTSEQFEHFLRKNMAELSQHGNEIQDAKYFCRLVLMRIYGKQHKVDLDFAAKIAKIEDATSANELVSYLLSLFVEYQKSQQKYPEAVEQVLSYVKENYMQELSLKKVAEVLHMSSVYLGAIFKKNIGESFAQYLNNYRVARSIELMTETHQNINEIALAVGYQNTNYFFRVFKEQTKMAPSEYRRMVVEKNNRG